MRFLCVLCAAIATARAIHLRPRVAPRPAPARLGALAPAALDGARTRVAALRMAEAESEGQEEDVEVIPLLAAGVAALGAVALVATAAATVVISFVAVCMAVPHQTPRLRAFVTNVLSSSPKKL